MEHTYWQKQGDSPLFPELEWNKPERRDQAGRLLIVGGNVHALSAPAQAYEQAKNTGIGDARLMLPDKTKRLVGKDVADASFLPSTKSGELSHEAAPEIIGHAARADALLFPGDNGRNSQTAILFEETLSAYTAEAILCRDAIDILSNHPATLLERPRTTLVVSFAQLQKLVQHYQHPSALTFTMDLLKLVAFLHELTAAIPANLITLHQNQFVCAQGGKVSTTKLPAPKEDMRWRVEMAAHAACIITWYPKKPFESITEAALLTARATA